MKINFVLLIAVGWIISVVAFSAVATSSSVPSVNTSLSSSMKTPCKNIATACKAAGKGVTRAEMWESCIKPILKGQTVNGVTVDAADVKACKTKLQIRMNRKD